MNENKEEVAGYREAPEQQKVGGVEGEPSQQDTTGQEQRPSNESKNGEEQGTAPYSPEDDKGTPDYGSNSPEDQKEQ
ncbi:hypothetical protein LLH06_14010 [Mucilaginibacter daejeonensis]|uniref:hypothetical protein n=1 Tax=Mucilaginibacter daejeonensis TaxID=398049 RepID=UPI001D179DF2|nr:hypothetical protein [Mucilaginibacter daejeonensis]UEG52076.1 hypothetical protein LLH06_14010 [Mucilaginibacter daejeonensis]